MRPFNPVLVYVSTVFVHLFFIFKGFKGYGVEPGKLQAAVPFVYEGKEFTMKHGSVLIAAITSCTNTSNPRLT